MTRNSNGRVRGWLRRPGVVSVALAAVTVGLFAPAVTCEFINFDDPQYVILNPHVQAGLTQESVAWAFTTVEAASWQPLTWLSLELDGTLFGLNPAGYHATSVVLHVANAVLLFCTLLYMTGDTTPSACVALLFAIHPLHVESVAWVSERKDVLSALFWMLLLLAYARYAERPSAARYAAMFVLMALGLCTKTMLVTLPFALLLLDYWPLRRFAGPQEDGLPAGPSRRFARSSVARLMLEKVPLLALSILFGYVAVVAQTRGRAVATTELLPLPYRLMNAADAYLAYLWKAVWPLNLAILYPHPMKNVVAGVAIAETVILAAASVWVCRRWRRQPYLVVGWFWYLGTLVPVIGIVQIGAQAIADRYTYIPLVGIFIVCAWGMADLIENGRVSQRLAGALCAAAFLSFGAGTWNQLGYWHDDITLWRHSIAVTGPNWQACECLGLAFLRRGLAREAVPLLREVASATPSYGSGHFSLGMALMMSGKTSEAKEELELALRLNPDYAEAHENLALVLEAEGRWQEAEGHLREALRADPRQWKIRLTLAGVLKRQGRLDDADREINQALAINPHALEDIPQRSSSSGSAD